MGELVPTNSSLSPPVPPATTCGYCGSRLDPNFYFCIRCATPYKSIEAVTSPAVPLFVSGEQLVQRKAPHVKPLFFTYLGVVLGSAILSLVVTRGDPKRFDTMLLFSEAAMLITTAIFAFIHWRTLAVQLSRLGLLHWAAWAGLAALAPLLCINYYYHSWITQAAGLKESPFDALRNSPLGMQGLILLVAVMPAIIEEIAFRGLLQHWLHVALVPWKAIVVASFLFTVLHFSPISFPYLFVLGCLLGWTKWKTGSLYPAMLIHFAHNFTVLQL